HQLRAVRPEGRADLPVFTLRQLASPRAERCPQRRALPPDGEIRAAPEPIGFAYRLHLYVDRHHNTATNATLRQLGNQAGVFADSDNILATIVQAGAVGLWNWSLSTGVSSGAFDAVEKPVVLEITAPGL